MVPVSTSPRSLSWPRSRSPASTTPPSSPAATPRSRSSAERHPPAPSTSTSPRAGAGSFPGNPGKYRKPTDIWFGNYLRGRDVGGLCVLLVWFCLTCFVNSNILFAEIAECGASPGTRRSPCPRNVTSFVDRWHFNNLFIDFILIPKLHVLIFLFVYVKSKIGNFKLEEVPMMYVLVKKSFLEYIYTWILFCFGSMRFNQMYWEF